MNSEIAMTNYGIPVELVVNEDDSTYSTSENDFYNKMKKGYEEMAKINLEIANESVHSDEEAEQLTYRIIGND